MINNINFLLEVAKFYVQFFSGKKGPHVCGHFVTNFGGGQVAFGEVESNYYNNNFASTFCYESRENLFEKLGHKKSGHIGHTLW